MRKAHKINNPHFDGRCSTPPACGRSAFDSASEKSMDHNNEVPIRCSSWRERSGLSRLKALSVGVVLRGSLAMSWSCFPYTRNFFNNVLQCVPFLQFETLIDEVSGIVLSVGSFARHSAVPNPFSIVFSNRLMSRKGEQCLELFYYLSVNLYGFVGFDVSTYSHIQCILTL